MTLDLSAPSTTMGDLTFRTPRVTDASAVWQLSRESGALDENSPYAYLLVCSHFAATSVVVEQDGNLVAFASCYRPPTSPEAVFVWQIAVHASLRGRGVGRAVLDAVLDQPANRDATHVEATVTASNDPSQRLFRSLAADLDAPCHTSVLFPAEAFPSMGHEAELLFRIGPLRSRPSRPTAPAARSGRPVPPTTRNHTS